MSTCSNNDKGSPGSLEDNCVRLTSSLSLQETISQDETYSKQQSLEPVSTTELNSTMTSFSTESGISENSLLNEISPETPFQSLIESVSRGSSHKKKESGANIAPKSKSTIKIFKHSRQHPPNPDTLPPCRVCGEKASGLHYGVNTCEPCKGFFRRSIVKVIKNKEAYTCIKEEGNCKLGSGKCTMCSYCRYKKCLEVGMSQDAIKIGRYTYSKRTNDFIEVTKLTNRERQEDGKREEVCNLASQINTTKNNPCDNAEEKEVTILLEKLIAIQEEMIADYRQGFKPNALLEKQMQIYERHMERVEMFGNLGSLPKNIYEEFHNVTGLELDDRKDKMSLIVLVMEKYILNMVKFARNIPGFTDLPTKDQATLLKAGFFEYWFLGIHNRINAELNVIVLDGISLLGGPGAHISEFSNIECGGSYKMSENAAILQKCQFTIEELTITRGILLTFTDRVKLDEPEEVEKIQWNLINMLRCVCKQNHKNPDERIWQIFDKFTILRTYSEYAKELNKIKAQWPIMQKHPLVLEMMVPETNIF